MAANTNYSAFKKSSTEELVVAPKMTVDFSKLEIDWSATIASIKNKKATLVMAGWTDNEADEIIEDAIKCLQ